MAAERDVIVSEVGLRDGLQNIDQVVGLETKKRWIAAEAAAGVPEIEVGSFVNYRVLPQMADTSQLVAFAKSIDGLIVAVLVPNARGAEMAINSGVNKLSVPVSASETHSQKNVNRTHPQMIKEIENIRSLINACPADARPSLEVGIATAFGCTIEGHVSESTVVKLAESLISAGADEIGLSDTTGYANPMMIRQRIRAVHTAVGKERLTGIHLHNTRGLGLANALAALEEGMTTLDSSLAGLGGCPFAPGSSGNIVTEDLVFMLESMGLRTGINIEDLFDVRNILKEHLPDIPRYGFMADAGIPLGWQSGPRTAH